MTKSVNSTNNLLQSELDWVDEYKHTYQDDKHLAYVKSNITWRYKYNELEKSFSSLEEENVLLREEIKLLNNSNHKENS